ncbi:MAG: hypothetical protein KAG18_01145 [Sinobacterium sp.]|nr:hypothetical protein [Sinobacterium sp.]
MKILLVIIAIVLMACNSSSKKISKPAGKPLFSVWHHTLTNDALDLTETSFEHSTAMNIHVSSEGACRCELTLNGDDSSGSFELNNCIVHTGDSDLECNVLNNTGDYTNTGSVLILTSSVGGELKYK